MKKILAIILVLGGIAGGGAAGLMLKPEPPASDGAQSASSEMPDDATVEPQKSADQGGAIDPASYVKVGRQTIVPILEDGETKALMMFELAVDVASDQSDRALEMEPRLRDAFLRELFQMSYTGAFDQTFTDDRVIDELRRNLVRAAQEHLGKKAVNDVLILDVMRQNTP
ncbi:MAG: flagellar basal body-associated FliL family protein [Pseudomonadota bacterium]